MSEFTMLITKEVRRNFHTKRDYKNEIKIFSCTKTTKKCRGLGKTNGVQVNIIRSYNHVADEFNTKKN